MWRKISTSFNIKASSAGSRAVSGRRRPAQDHAFIAYRHVPSPPPGRTLAPVEDAFTSAACLVVVAVWPLGLLAGHGLASEVVALAAVFSPPALSESSESHVRSYRAKSDRFGPNATGRPRRGGPHAILSESHPSGESGNTGRRRRAHIPTAAGAGWGRSARLEGVWVGSKTINAIRGTANVPTFVISLLSIEFIFVAPLTCTLYWFYTEVSTRCTPL